MLRRGLGARLLRREGPPPEHDPPRGRPGHPRAHPQLAAAGGPGTLITPLAPTDDGTAPAAIACKRGLTRIDIASTRMLMAYGFLRRVFEVFERFRTPRRRGHHVRGQRLGDHRRPPRARRIVAELSAFADVSVRGRDGDRLRGRREAARRRAARRPACWARSRACRSRWSRRAARGRTSRSCCATRTCRRRWSGCTGASSRRPALGPAAAVQRLRSARCGCWSSDTGGWGGWSSSSPRSTVSRSPASLDRGQQPGRRRRDRRSAAAASTWPSTSRRRGDPRDRPDAGGAGRRRSSWAPTGWQAREAELRAAVAARGVGAVVSARTSRGGATCSTRWSSAPAACFAGRRGATAPSSTRRTTAQEGRAVGHGAELRRALERGGLRRPRRRLARRARAASRGRTRVGFDGPAETLALTHTVRDRATLRRTAPCGGALGRSAGGRLVRRCGTCLGIVQGGAARCERCVHGVRRRRWSRRSRRAGAVDEAGGARAWRGGRSTAGRRLPGAVRHHGRGADAPARGEAAGRRDSSSRRRRAARPSSPAPAATTRAR